MIQLNHKWLDDLGLAKLSDEAKDSLLAHTYDQLELNVGTVIASQLSDAQIKEFEELIDGGNQEQARDWLKQNYPGYQEVVKQELQKLKDELIKNTSAILGADAADNLSGNPQ